MYNDISYVVLRTIFFENTRVKVLRFYFVEVQISNIYYLVFHLPTKNVLQFFTIPRQIQLGFSRRGMNAPFCLPKFDRKKTITMFSASFFPRDQPVYKLRCPLIGWMLWFWICLHWKKGGWKHFWQKKKTDRGGCDIGLIVPHNRNYILPLLKSATPKICQILFTRDITVECCNWVYLAISVLE